MKCDLKTSRPELKRGAAGTGTRSISAGWEGVEGRGVGGGGGGRHGGAEKKKLDSETLAENTGMDQNVTSSPSKYLKRSPYLLHRGSDRLRCGL